MCDDIITLRSPINLTAGWTHCAVVVVHKQKAYLLLPTLQGVDVLPAAKQIRKWQAEGVQVAVRQLRGADAERVGRTSKDLLHGALQGCAWDRYLPELQRDAGGRVVAVRTNQVMRLPRMPAGSPSLSASEEGSKGRPPASPSVPFSPPIGGLGGAGSITSPGADRFGALSLASPPPIGAGTGLASGPLGRRGSTHTDAASSTGSDASEMPSFIRSFLRLLIPRVWAALSAVPPQVEVELRRAFARADRDGDGLVGMADVQGILQDVRGNDVTKGEAEQFVRLMQLPPSEGASISLDHFLYGLARRPLQEIPVEHDLQAILCGEFTATMYELCGLLPVRTAATLSPAVSTSRSEASAGSPSFGLSEASRRGSLSSHCSGTPVAGGSGSGGFAVAPHAADSFSPTGLQATPRDAAAAHTGVKTLSPRLPEGATTATMDAALVFGLSRRNSAGVLPVSEAAAGIASPPGRGRASVPHLGDAAGGLLFGGAAVGSEPPGSRRSSGASTSHPAGLQSPPGGFSAASGDTSREHTGASAAEPLTARPALPPNLRSASVHMVPAHAPAASSTAAGFAHAGAATARHIFDAFSPMRTSRGSLPGSGADMAGGRETTSPAAGHLAFSPPSGVGGVSGALPLAAGASLTARTTSKSSAVGGGATIVVIDSTCGDLRHFLPATFSSSFEPHLALLRGRLELEALVDAAEDGVIATGSSAPAPLPADASAAVQLLTASVFGRGRSDSSGAAARAVQAAPPTAAASKLESAPATRASPAHEAKAAEEYAAPGHRQAPTAFSLQVGSISPQDLTASPGLLRPSTASSAAPSASPQLSVVTGSVSPGAADRGHAVVAVKPAWSEEAEEKGSAAAGRKGGDTPSFQPTPLERLQQGRPASRG